MRRQSYRSDQRGVSDVIGTILLLGITVVLFTGLAFAVMDEIQRTPPPANAEFRVDTVEDRTTMSLVWGESMVLSDVKLIFDLDGVKQNLYLTASPLAGNLTHRSGGSALAWDLGESLRLACGLGESCAYPGQSVENVTVVQWSVGTVVFSTEEGVLPGAMITPLADIASSVGVVQDPARTAGEPLYVGGTFVVPAVISNSGLIATPAGATIDVEYFLDGSAIPFYTTQRSGTLLAGDSFAVQNPPMVLPQGPHAVRVHAQSNPEFPEAGLTNNDATANFNVVAGIYDPGGAYEDGNNDVLYNPYEASDTLLAVGFITDGVHTSAAGKGLVIPPSVGSLSVGAQINFVGSTHLHVGVTLETTGSGARTIRLTAGTDLNLTGTVQLRSAEHIILTATGRLDVSGDSLDTSGSDDITLATTTGPILAIGTNFYIVGLGSEPDDVTITAASGLIDLNGAVAKTSDDFRVTTNGPIGIQNMNLDVEDDANLDVTLATNRVYVQNAFIHDDLSFACADVDPNDPNIIVGTTNPPGRVGTGC